MVLVSGRRNESGMLISHRASSAAPPTSGRSTSAPFPIRTRQTTLFYSVPISTPYIYIYIYTSIYRSRETYSSYINEGTSLHIVTVYRRNDTIAPVTTNSTRGRMISVSSALMVALVSRLDSGLVSGAICMMCDLCTHVQQRVGHSQYTVYGVLVFILSLGEYIPTTVIDIDVSFLYLYIFISLYSEIMNYEFIYTNLAA